MHMPPCVSMVTEGKILLAVILAVSVALAGPQGAAAAGDRVERGHAAAADATGPYTPSWASVCTHPVPSWFPGAKFGIYAHFGVFSVPAFGSEWYSHNMYVPGSPVRAHHEQAYGAGFGYKDFVPNFTASRFDADVWAKLYRRAGAQYAGPVAEHADGFAMFNTSASAWNAVQRGPRRDVAGEVIAAVRRQGLNAMASMHHMWLWAWYPTWDSKDYAKDVADVAYQLTDQAGHGGLYGQKVTGPDQWSHPNTTKLFNDYFVQKAEDLTHGYKPDLVYFDSKFAATIDEAHRLEFLADFYNLAYANGNQQVTVTYKSTDLEVGAGILDYERGGVTSTQSTVWQTDDSMDRNSWSWVEPPSLKNSTELVGELVDIVSKNGSFLLNVPPKADGSFDPRVVDTLMEIGDWLATNGMAIYKTSPWGTTCCEGPTQIVPGFNHEWPIFTNKDFRFTTADGAIFVVAFDWPASNSYLVKSINSTVISPATVSDVTLAGSSGAKVSFIIDADGLHLSTTSTPSAELAYVFRVHLGGASQHDIDSSTATTRHRILN